MITIFDRYYAEDGTLEYERQCQVVFGPIAEMIKSESWNIEGFHQKILSRFLLEETDYSTTFTEFQVDGMGVILKEITARLDPEEHARYRAYWKTRGYRGSWPSVIYWPVFYF
ncbi:MAG: hypothetical protein ACFFAE_09015 [Candidatus Hodarchaeota archaeon]